MKKLIILFSLIFSSYSFGAYNPYATNNLTGAMGFPLCINQAFHKEIMKLQTAVASTHKNLYTLLKSNRPIHNLDKKIENFWKAIGSLNAEIINLTCKKDPTKKTKGECIQNYGTWLDNTCYVRQEG
ncbi:MAG: hypothetical protein OXN83_00355 [Oligoflexia bacterium]|nr:hypothetical protein [Oligoflexia bacterium]